MLRTSAPGRRRPRRLLLLAGAVGASTAFAASPVASVVGSTPPQPRVVSVTPAHGPAEGGNRVVVGTVNLGYTPGITRVSFSGVPSAVVGSDSNSLTVIAPAGAEGSTVDVTAMNFGPTYGPTDERNSYPADDYTYDGPKQQPLTLTPDHGLPSGTAPVTITAADTDFTTVREVRFGGKAATIQSRTATSVTVVPPPADPLTSVIVKVTLASGHVDGTSTSVYRYDASPDRPVVSGLSLDRAYADQYKTLTIRGSALESATKVEFGTEPVGFYRRGGELTVYLTGVHAPGVVDVRVTTPAGVSANTPADDFTFLAVPPRPVITSVSPSSGPVAGGTLVTVRGTDLGAAENVQLSEDYVTAFEQVSNEEIRFRTPLHQVGLPLVQDVRIYTPGGASSDGEPTTADDFTYVPAPAVTGLSQKVGLAGFGGVTTVSGKNLAEIRGVRFGSAKATAWYVVGNKLVVVAPPLPKGTYSVRVTTASGTSAGSTAGAYQYIGR